jgi:hypothetical protein
MNANFTVVSTMVWHLSATNQTQMEISQGLHFLTLLSHENLPNGSKLIRGAKHNGMMILYTCISMHNRKSTKEHHFLLPQRNVTKV